MDEPLVSVVLPTRNRAQSVRTAVDSVLSQDYERLELIVVDDASVDETVEQLKQVDDERLIIVSQPCRVGAAEARNRGLSVVSGELVSFQDSDTMWTPGRLRRHVDTFLASGPEVAVVYGYLEFPTSTGYERFPSDLDTIRDGDLLRVLLRYNIVDLPASTVRCSAIKAVQGFDPDLPRHQDWDLYLRLSLAWRFAFTGRVDVQSGSNTDRISLNQDAHFQALEIILTRHLERFRCDPVSLVAWTMQLLRKLLADKDLRRAAKWIGVVTRHPAALARWICERLRGTPHVNDRRIRPLTVE